MKDKEINLYKLILGGTYVFFAFVLNSYNLFWIHVSLILALICVYLQELTIYKLENDNNYNNKFKLSIRSFLYLSGFLLIDYICNKRISVKNIIMIYAVAIISCFLCSLTMKFEVKYREKKYHSTFMESKYWKKRSENFKWNYSDLRKVAYRGSEIVGWIGIAYLVVCTTIVSPTWIVYILLFISLYHLEFQAMMDRVTDINAFRAKKYSDRYILKFISTQFIWMILRGIFIGVIGVCVIWQVKDNDILHLKLLFEMVVITLISYAALSLAVSRYLAIESEK